MLMVEAILRDRDLSVAQFKEIFKETPSNRFRAPVVDRQNFRLNPEGTALIDPFALQNYIDQ